MFPREVIPRLLPVVLGVLALATPAAAVEVLTTGKHAVLRSKGGFLAVVADPVLASVDNPCAGSTPPRLILSSYPQATLRVVTHVEVALPCAHWTRTRGGWRYDGKSPGDAVERLVLSPRKLNIRFGGDGWKAPSGPVGYLQAWLETGERRLLVRFHDFRVNRDTLLVARKPSTQAAAGEAAFWDVLLGDDRSESRQQACIAALTKAARQGRRDGRSRFLLAMIHLYRFGQLVTDYASASPAAVAELAAAVDAFEAATPLLWDHRTRVGDSRVPGFAAAAKYGLGRVRGDSALEAAGLAELEAAVDINPFFNLFDLLPVAQAVPPTDPQFAIVMSRVTPYLDDPETIACVGTQPEICANSGLAPRNVEGALTLFGDLFVKASATARSSAERDTLLARAQQWYTLAAGFAAARPGYRFQAALDERIANIAARAAAYATLDPSDDPPIIGAATEACAACHNR